MARGAFLRFLTAAAVLAGQAVLAALVVVLFPTASDAQWFWGGDQGGHRSGFDWFEQRQDTPEPQRPAPPPDFSRAPAPRKPDPKAEAAVTTPILVLGDSMADWLGYGLEQAYADSPEIGILRRHKTNSGLIRTETRKDPRGEYPDWPQAARDLIAGTKPKFVLIMVGVNDRRQFREVTQAPPPRVAPKPPAAPAAPQTAPQQGQDGAATEEDKPAGDDKPRTADSPPPSPPSPAAPATPAAPPVVKNLDFPSDAWSEAYSRRIDETIAALKTSGVPVFWVGLPPLRGQKASTDIPYLNDLFRSRADKAGIIYIDVWDGFVDEAGHYVQYGPDVEGQIRRLRTGDGVYFTQAGATKLAHYVQREIQRWLNNRPAPVAVTIPDDPKDAKSEPPAKAGPRARPLSGPAVPLTAERAMESDDLLGGNGRPQGGDAIAARVLVQGDPVPAPAGRADDFTWPRRGVAPTGADPVVATTELPMTPMVAEKTSPTAVATASSDPNAAPGAQAPKQPLVRRPRPAYLADSQGIYRPDYRRPAAPPQPQPWSFNSLFGTPGWYRR